jgi:hypothetical protein
MFHKRFGGERPERASMTQGTRRGADEQQDVLDKKDKVIESPTRGLQQYGDEAIPEGGFTGTGSMGTAERAAKITRAQLEAKERSEQP